ncbi:hypothetical protein [Petroclostridium sp. X23]|uniref:hypothetical protein n=1 Tax=Petroclostridium sp. X23 TaxID=3045146 RepID=UPI0024AE23D1|nr:hypothetical protein [Petroclostridium sp. X23]WHH60399.1 hypothetical protein QKW49_06655 [Petroclostridium sp. X23]
MVDFWMTQNVIQWINEFSVSAYRKFYPSAPAKDLGIDMKNIFECLVYLADQNMLELEYEKRCPECASKMYEDEVEGFVYCESCDDDIELTSDVVFPIFSVSENYRNEVKKNKQVQKNNLLLSFARKKLQQSLCDSF